MQIKVLNDFVDFIIVIFELAFVKSQTNSTQWISTKHFATFQNREIPVQLKLGLLCSNNLLLLPCNKSYNYLYGINFENNTTK